MVTASAAKNSYWHEYGFAFCATTIQLASGTSFAWTSPTLPKLMDPSLEHPITKNEGSWIASLFILSACISPIFASLIVDRWGRRTTLLLSAVPIIISWVIVMLDTRPAWLYVSRLMSGWNHGMIYSVIPLYLGEVASKEVRGSIGILTTVMFKLGILLAYSIGPFVTIFKHAAILLSIPIVFVLTFWWCPESPYYLILKQKEDKAQRTLQRIRGREDVTQELQDIITAVTSERENPGSFSELFRTKGNRRGVIVMMALACCLSLSGSPAVLAYAQQIFEETEGILDAKISTIVLGVVQLAATILASMIVDRLGRRLLLIISTTGVALMTALIGLYFFMKQYLEWDMSNINMLPLILILTYIVLYNIGLSAVSFVIIGELFPTNVKAIAASSFFIIFQIINFAVIKSYQVIADSLGTYTAFWIFFVCTVVCVIFIIIYTPETKGKMLSQIQKDINAISK